jgi:LacI family transcriptional regulator
VAREAGVGLGTASRALDPRSQYVAADVRARVLETARRLGYRPNMSARATTTGATATVTVLVSDIRDPYNARLVHGAIESANRAGLIVTVAGTDHLIEDETRVVRLARSMRPRALVLTGIRSGSAVSRDALLRELSSYEQDGGRIVIAGDDELPFDTAVVPRRRGARELVRTLGELGYRRPVLVAPELDSTGTREWETGVLDGARDTALTVDAGAIARAPMTRDGGYRAAEQLIPRLTEGFDVLLAATDTMALGAMSALRAAGLRPGVDVAVAGFDDVVDADDVTPGLTSVDLALEGDRCPRGRAGARAGHG